MKKEIIDIVDSLMTSSWGKKNSETNKQEETNIYDMYQWELILKTLKFKMNF